MSSEPSKRASGKHYTPRDRDILKNIVKEYVEIIENKKTDNASVKAKNQAWESVTQTFNMSTGISEKRTSKQIRTLWTNMKASHRSQKTKEMQAVMATGGGTCPPPVDIDQDMELLVPHLMETAPCIMSSNMSEDEQMMANAVEVQELVLPVIPANMSEAEQTEAGAIELVLPVMAAQDADDAPSEAEQIVTSPAYNILHPPQPGAQQTIFRIPPPSSSPSGNSLPSSSKGSRTQARGRHTSTSSCSSSELALERHQKLLRMDEERNSRLKAHDEALFEMRKEVERKRIEHEMMKMEQADAIHTMKMEILECELRRVQQPNNS